MSDLAGMFTDPNWKALNQAQNEARGFSPNRGFYNATERKAAIVIQRAARGDFALSKAALDGLIAAETKADKVGQSFVILKERGDRGVVAFLAAREVRSNLGAVQPFEGDFGPFWWIDATFKLPGGSLADDEIPF